MRHVYLVMFLLPLIALRLSGDTVELKNGERIDGTFKQATSEGAVIEVAGQAITIPLQKVKAIYLGAAPSTAANSSTPAREALDALRGLQSVTETGLNYRDYATRVLDAKVKVDRYLSAFPNDPPELRKSIGVAMREYELARESWMLNDERSWRGLATSENLQEGCPVVPKLLNDSRLKTAFILGSMDLPEQARSAIKVDGMSPHQALWKCAIAEGARAENMLVLRQ
jgi:hypothetical protein